MRVFIFISLISLALLSCAEQDRELLIIEQEADIDAYISSEFADNKIIMENGSIRVILKEAVPTTDSLEYGDSLSFHYAGYVFDNTPTLAFATNLKEAADSIPFILSNPDYSPTKVIFKEDIYIKGLTNGLLGVKAGEHSVILFSAKYGFNNESVYNIPKLSALIYEVWIEKITKNN